MANIWEKFNSAYDVKNLAEEVAEAEDEDGLFQAAFKTEEGRIYFLAEFLRIDY